MAENIKKEDSPVAPAAPEPKDPLAEIKEMLAGLCHKVEAIEAKVGGVAPATPAAPTPVAPVVKAEVVKEEVIEKAEPVKTEPIFMGQDKQEDKELGANKVSGQQYLHKEDAEKMVISAVEKTVSSLIQKMGFTETGKKTEPVAHPLEKVDPQGVTLRGEGGIASMNFEQIEDMATKMRGVRYG